MHFISSFLFQQGFYVIKGSNKKKKNEKERVREKFRLLCVRVYVCVCASKCARASI